MPADLPLSAIDRRTFLLSGSAAAAASLLPAAGAAASLLPAAAAAARPAAPARRPLVIASGNGLNAVARAYELLAAGEDPAVAIVEGVTLVEDDPDDMSVGYGGLPNEEGVVQLDASVMHGPTHKAGAVACLENIRNPAKVALEVLRRTDHVLLVGEGALRFARALGFKEENLLTERAREAWLRWKQNQNPDDDWLDRDQVIPLDAGSQPHSWRPGPDSAQEAMAKILGIPWTHGTIHCSAVTAAGDLAGCTTTSGLSYKIPGRVGDSPIVGAGMFTDNEVGSAGATGRGEAAIQSCSAFQVVRHMADGEDPAQACVSTLKWVADHTRRPALLRQDGRPAFGLTLYAVRKDGAFGSATMYQGGSFAVCDADGPRQEPCAFLFE